MKQAITYNNFGYKTHTHPYLNVWFKWVFANLWGELAGFAMVAMVGAFFLSTIQGSFSVITPIIMMIVLVLAGACMGLFIGFAQSVVLQEAIPDLPKSGWITATTVSTIIAWMISMIPFIYLTFGRDVAAGRPLVWSETVVTIFGALMGALFGAILGFAQYLVLSSYVKKAGLWIVASVLAWTLAMPQLFAGIGGASGPIPAWQATLLAIVSIISAAATVGAIQGLFMYRLIRLPRR